MTIFPVVFVVFALVPSHGIFPEGIQSSEVDLALGLVKNFFHSRSESMVAVIPARPMGLLWVVGASECNARKWGLEEICVK